MSEWVDHAGLGDPKIPGDTPVEVKFRDGDTGQGVMHDWDQNWQWACTDEGRTADGAIIAYRLATPATNKDGEAE